MDLLILLEGLAVAGLALSGGLAAVGRRLNVAACCLAALTVGLVGGTLRDLLVGQPVFWLDRPVYLAVSLVAAGIAWAVGERPWRRAAMAWADAAGVSALSAVAAARAADGGVSPLASAAVGLFAVAAAALLRDLVSADPPLLAGREFYLAAAAAGCLGFVGLRLIGLDDGVSAVGGTALAFALRAGAMKLGWSLPEAGEGD